MNLNDFESYVDKKILARGYDYYENDYVTSIEETGSNVFEAEVEGTETYTVEAEIDGKANIIDTQCDCLYDMGKYCKHQVAVFLALRDMKNNLSGGINHMPKKCQSPESVIKSQISKKRKAPDIKEILSERTKDELIELLLDIAAEYEEIKQRIELNFDAGNDEDEITKSIALIRTFIWNNSDRNEFVAYGDTDEAVKGADLVLEKACITLGKNKAIHALALALYPDW